MAFNKAKALLEAEKSVGQGKIQQAIKLYLDIISKDPADHGLLNNLGDLYVRDKNVPEALKQFNKLADAYVQDGFTLRAIAIYKKINKLDSSTVEPLVKLAELYQLQGLSREAREQYNQAVEFYRKKNQNDKALEILRKVVQIDPENAPARARLATFCEQLGKKDDAAKVYLEVAELALRKEDAAGAQAALTKASGLSPKSPEIQLFRARVAMRQQQLEEVEKLLAPVPELKDNSEARALLLEAYLGLNKLEQAKGLVLEVFKANPADSAPLVTFVGLCLNKNDIETAFRVLSQASGDLLAQKNQTALVEGLEQIVAKEAEHVPALELLHEVCEKTADEMRLPEVLLALGKCYTKSGDLAKAEQVYEKLCKREPDNEHYKGLLKDTQKKLGKEVPALEPQELEASELALDSEAGTATEAQDAEQAAAVKEALENSDLFARYNLPEKAVVELEKVITLYPARTDIHQRIIEVCRKNIPARAAQAALALSRIFAERGDTRSAKRYQQMAQELGAAEFAEEVTPVVEAEAGPAVVEPAAAPAPMPPPQAAPAPAQEIELSKEFSLSPAEGAAANPAETAPPPIATPFDLAGAAAPVAETSAPSAASSEFDLSGDLAALTAPPPPAEAPAEEGAFNYEESRVEIDFYLENGFVEEAQRAVTALEAKLPGNPQVAQLRQRVEAKVSGAVGAVAPPLPATPQPEAMGEAQPGAAAGPAVQEWQLPESLAPEAVGPAVEAPPAPSGQGAPPAAVAPPAPEIELAPPVEVIAPPGPPPPPVAEIPSVPPVELPPPPPVPAPPVAEAAPVELEPAPAPAAPPMPEAPPAPAVVAAAPSPPPTPAEPKAAEPGGGLLGDLAGDLASSLGDFGAAAAPAPPPAPAQAAGAGAAAGGASALSGLLDELAEPETGAGGKEDIETYYNLGVAYREMGLLDEAIGAFQKILKGAQKGHYPAHYLQSCSLLAVCFMDKKMPAIAVKWYLRALEAPDLDDEATLALQYDLGAAYEQAGDTRAALEKFTEVYSQNIDYRDVAEKIRVLQQKAP